MNTRPREYLSLPNVWRAWARVPFASQRRAEMRHYLAQRSRDYSRRGKGNRAWKRAAALDRGAYHLGAGIYLQFGP